MESENELLNDADILDMVWAETEADFIRHSEARVIFMNYLVQHLRKQKLFSQWTIQSELFIPASELRNGISLFYTLKRQSAPVSVLLTAQATSTAQVYKFIQSLRVQSKPLVTRMIDHYAEKELKLQWEWLRFELYRAWLTDLLGWITNTPQKLIYQPIPRQEPAPQVEYHFQTYIGETFPAMLARFKEETDRFFKEKADEYERQFPRGTMRKDQDVGKYVEWFFRREVLKEPLKHIAKYEADGKERPWSQQPKDVKKYAKVAKDWLRLGFSEENLRKSGWGSGDDPATEGEGS